MSEHQTPTGCACCNLSRRNFFAAGCAATAACVGTTTLLSEQTVYGRMNEGKKTVRVFFALHSDVQKQPDWPNIGFDFRPVIKEYMDALQKGSPDLNFVASLANGPESADQIIAKDGKEVIGYIVFQMNCWNQVLQSTLATQKPTLYCDFLYAGSGGFLVYTGTQLKAKTPNFTFMSTSNLRDIVDAAKCFNQVAQGESTADFVAAVNTLRKERTKPYNKELKLVSDDLECLSTEELFAELKGQKLLTVGGPWADYKGVAKEYFGIDVIDVPFAELNEAWEKADKGETQKIVDRWKKEATAIKDVSDETLFASAAMVLAEKALLDEYKAAGVTINCLGGFYGGHIHAYPCLGFHELGNEGLIGACECDIRSTLTMLILKTMTKGRPGYISDPVMDSATRQIIYAHCVAPNRVFGPKGPTNPFEILTHSEDRQGASVRSIVPIGYMTTTVEIAPEKKQILFHQGVVVDNSLEDRACRTKIAAEIPGDFEKLFTEWGGWSWHRVTVYGDVKQQIFDLAKALNWEVVEEA
ncbi:MAG: hypothetical protein ACRC10_10265 [Thermoguttaceae bacterium]